MRVMESMTGDKREEPRTEGTLLELGSDFTCQSRVGSVPTCQALVFSLSYPFSDPESECFFNSFLNVALMESIPVKDFFAKLTL